MRLHLFRFSQSAYIKFDSVQVTVLCYIIILYKYNMTYDSNHFAVARNDLLLDRKQPVICKIILKCI